MAITATQIQFRLSIPGETGGNTAAQPDANDSLGGWVSTTTIQAATLNNLFDDVSGDENAASDIEYRGFFVYNSNITLGWESTVMWLSATVTGGALASIAVDGTAASTVGYSAASQMLEIPDESTEPTGPPTWLAPTSKGTGISLGTIPLNSVRGVWVQRLAQNSAALNNDGITISFEGDTAA